MESARTMPAGEEELCCGLPPMTGIYLLRPVVHHKHDGASRPTPSHGPTAPASVAYKDSLVVRNYWIFFLEAGERADGLGGLRSKTALDDGPPKRDNSQGLQPSVSGSYLNPELHCQYYAKPIDICFR